MADPIDVERLRAALVTSGGPWRELEHHLSLPSTNARALELARPWQVVTADHQSAGRGRMSRAWESPPGASLLLTATVPMGYVDPAGLDLSGWLPLVTGLAVLATVEGLGVEALLKWPNDVLLPADDDRKVAGILCEVGAADAATDRRVVAIGVGLNVAQTRDELPVPTATSLRLAGASYPDLTDLAATLLAHLGGGLTSLSAMSANLVAGQGVDDVRAAYWARCSTIGRSVRLSRVAAPDLLGEAVAVDDAGRLVMEVDGVRTAWAAGDVVHVRGTGTTPPTE